MKYAKLMPSGLQLAEEIRTPTGNFKAKDNHAPPNGWVRVEDATEWSADVVDVDGVPMQVTRLQAILALKAANKLTATELAVAKLGGDVKIAYDNAQNFERGSKFVDAVAKELKLSKADVDALFISAATIL